MQALFSQQLLYGGGCKNVQNASVANHKYCELVIKYKMIKWVYKGHSLQIAENEIYSSDLTDLPFR